MRARPVPVLIFAVLIGVASWLTAGRVAAKDGQSPRPPAPDFSVSRYSDGRTVSLSDVRGKVVLLYFFFPS